MLNMNKTIFPGLSAMTVDEVRVMGKICREEGDTPEKILEIINCIDECLTILKSASIVNRMRGKRKWNQQSARDIVAQRVLQTNL